jgi:hypothetical protein
VTVSPRGASGSRGGHLRLHLRRRLRTFAGPLSGQVPTSRAVPAQSSVWVAA